MNVEGFEFRPARFALGIAAIILSVNCLYWFKSWGFTDAENVQILMIASFMGFWGAIHLCENVDGFCMLLKSVANRHAISQ